MIGEGCMTAEDTWGYLDCSFECHASGLVGNGECDDGEESDADFDCYVFDWDLGDCTSDWDVGLPPSFDGWADADSDAGVGPVAGEGCETADETWGYIDCSLECAPALWVGDGICHNGGESGANFDCYTFEYDLGDCESETEVDVDVDDDCWDDDCEWDECLDGGCESSDWDDPDEGSSDDSDGSSSGDIGDACDYTGVGEGLIDCVGVCGPAHWIGDGYCDDGEWGFDFISCDEFSEETPDCAS